MKKSYKKFIAFLITVSMVLTTVQIPAQAADIKVKSAESSNQMASEEEFVYLNAYDGSTRTQNFDRNWKFYLGEAENAQNPAFDDSGWKSISLPHDYSITQAYTKSGEAESGYLPGGTGWYRKSFSVPGTEGKRLRIDFGGAYMNATVYINGHKLGTHPYGYSPFSFDITDYVKYDQDNVIAVKTENKIPSSRWYSGSGLYRSVELTVTDPVHVALNGAKVVTPNLETELASGGGGGINVSIKTTLDNDSNAQAEVTLKQSVIPKAAPDLADSIGTVEQAGILVDPGSSKEVETALEASSPKLWTLDNPNLYLLRTQVIRDGQIIDTYDTEFGFRYIKMDPDAGFSLNGVPMKLKGVSMHHDQGSLGSAAYYRAMERQVEILKEMGCNAIRTTHNPADKKLMEICNEKGMLVVEEAYDTWLYPKNGNVNDFSKWYQEPIEAGNTIEGGTPGMTWAEFDLKAFMMRDYNDPSLIMYSLGNEVMEGLPGNADFSRYPQAAQKLINWAGEVDTTRPVTIGDNKLKGGWSESKEMGDELTAAGGMVGFNYTPGSGSNSLDYYHQQYPDWKMYGSETASAINSRGIYSFRGNINSPTGYQRTAYDESCVGWGNVASDAWYTVLTRDYMAGEFVWTGFDYIGEPTPWNGTGTGPAAGTQWPSPKSSYFGIVDTAGFPKDSYYFYQSQWNDNAHTLHILPAWNDNVVSKDNNNEVKVVVYTDAPSVELFFTPKGSDTPQPLGRKTFTQKHTHGGYPYQIYEGPGKSNKEYENLYLSWMVPYQDGTITAKAYASDGTEITDTLGRSSVATTGVPSKLSASVDRDTIVADGEDLSYITVDVTDEKGNLIPDAANRIQFSVEGNGELVGVDNGDASDHDSYQADNRKAFSGKALAIVRSTQDAGSFTLTASAPGLDSSSATVTTTPVPVSPGTEGGITGYKISKYYYVKTGTMPELPTVVTVRSSDGTDAPQTVTWAPIGDQDIQETGSFVATGTLEGGIPISVTINMIDDIAALLNYSCAVQTGGRPALPAQRPAVMANGQRLNAQLPVTWDPVDPSRFDSPGMVRIEGTSQVFGKELEVTADVRVSDEEITVGSNVAPNGTLKEDIPPGQTSDTLLAVTDGSTAYHAQVSGTLNTSCWTNRKFSQSGGTKSEITFEYATAERLAQAVIYYVEDSDSARVPEQTELFYSKGGTADEDWIEIPVTPQPGTEAGQVIPYTFKFNSPVDAVLFKISITNSTEVVDHGKPYTGITEIQLDRAVGSFTQYSDAELSGLVVNGVPVPESSLEKGSWGTPALVIDTLEAEGKNNAAVTVLPPYEGVSRLVIEAEDHSRQTVFQIQLGSEVQDPDDSSRDYDISKTTATAQNYQPSPDLRPGNAVDGDSSTFWHTKWGYTTPEADRWIMLTLDEAVELDALRYLPKAGSSSGDNNGRVHEYRVEVSENGTEWKTVSQGSWSDESGWKLAVFEKPETAKYVKLYGVQTYGDEAQNKYMNAAEVHVRKALPTIDITTQASVTLDSDGIELSQEGVPVEPPVYVSMDGVPLKYGLDYTVSYENNTTPGTATAKVKGILKYSGTVSMNFTVLEKNSQEISVSGGRITQIDGQPYDGGSTAKLAPGHLVKVLADAPSEGRTFSHWRIIPSNTPVTGLDQTEAVFAVPENACRLIAVYESADGSTGSATAISQSVPNNWFAFGREADLEDVLAEVLSDEDRQNVVDGNQVQVVMTIVKSETMPSLLSREKRQGHASPSNASPSNASPSNASNASNALPSSTSHGAGLSSHTASPSDAAYRTASSSDAAYRTASSSDAAYRTASSSDADYGAVNVDAEGRPAMDALDDYNNTDTVGFYLQTSLTKKTKEPGQTQTVNAAAPSRVEITFQLPEKDRDMANYTVIPYAENDGIQPAPAITPEVNGTLVSFDAAVNGVYELRYNLCYTVTFIDYDGRVISIQRVPKGEAAAAPDAPYREGYTFIGWNKAFDSVTRDMTIKDMYEKTGTGPSKAMLNEKILDIQEKMAGVYEHDYTLTSWNRLVHALNAAMETAANEDATQNEIAQAIQNLSLAWNGLKRPTPSYSHDDSDSDVVTGKQKKANPIPVTPGTWAADAKGWKYRLNNGSYAENQWVYINYNGVNEWYRFDANGDMVTKWYKDTDGNMYYLDPNPGSGKGRLYTGWHWITGDDNIARCYYFQEISNGTRGKLLSNVKTPDGYDVDEKGQWIVNGTVQIKE